MERRGSIPKTDTPYCMLQPQMNTILFMESLSQDNYQYTAITNRQLASPSTLQSFDATAHSLLALGATSLFESTVDLVHFGS
mmetsp:Transcript_10536/g.23350  ORF Transcript_10536/g.23350 Transcript_10536/m.23350 type:complete len:82 (-) Transcript_10536:277-522(-)